jgi:hypothetical protein
MSLFKNLTSKRIPVLFRKFKNRLAKKIDDAKNLDEIQIQTIKNIRIMMSKKDAILLIAPISGVCHIEWEHYFVKIGDSSITITNGKFSYYIWLPVTSMTYLKDMFYRQVEHRRKTLESKYDESTLSNLKSIYTQLMP